MHGLALAFDKLRMSLVSRYNSFHEVTFGRVLSSKLVRILGVLVTFHFVCFCWIFFKASSLEDAGIIITQIFSNFNAAAFVPLLSAYGTVFGVMSLGYLFHFMPKSYEYFSVNFLSKVSLVGRIAILLVFIWIVIQAKQAEPVLPIYLQF